VKTRKVRNPRRRSDNTFVPPDTWNRFAKPTVAISPTVLDILETHGLPFELLPGGDVEVIVESEGLPARRCRVLSQTVWLEGGPVVRFVHSPRLKLAGRVYTCSPEWEFFERFPTGFAGGSLTFCPDEDDDWTVFFTVKVSTAEHDGKLVPAIKYAVGIIDLIELHLVRRRLLPARGKPWLYPWWVARRRVAWPC